MSNKNGKLTQEECFSFMLDKDNKEIYPNIWDLIASHLAIIDSGGSQYLIEQIQEDK